MRTLRGAVLALCTLLVCAALAPGGRADNWNKNTNVTFSDAVEIPGQVLPAGLYVFKPAEICTTCRSKMNQDQSTSAGMCISFRYLTVRSGRRASDSCYRAILPVALASVVVQNDC